MKPVDLLIALCILLASAHAPSLLGQVVDAHIHGGFAYDDQARLNTSFDYFNEHDIQAFGFPLPIKRIEAINLLSMLTGEVSDLRVLAGKESTFTIWEDNSDLSNQGMTVFLGIEYFHGVFAGTADTIDGYQDLGVHYIVLVDNEHDRLFADDQLSKLGVDVIDRMNAAGILVDISHLDGVQAAAVIKRSRKPVIASHSATRQLADRSGNLDEDLLDLMGRSGGYVFVSFNTSSLFPIASDTGDGVAQLVAHISHCVDRLGIDYVGIGTDYQAGGKYVPGDLNRLKTYINIKERLTASGFNAAEVDKIMGGNFLRAMQVK